MAVRPFDSGTTSGNGRILFTASPRPRPSHQPRWIPSRKSVFLSNVGGDRIRKFARFQPDGHDYVHRVGLSPVLFTNGLLFHELVHVEQYRQLRIPRCSELYVDGFLTGVGYDGIPLEVHAY